MVSSEPAGGKHPRLTAEPRRRAILESVRAGRAEIVDLAAAFGVSTATVRRDLALLAERGEINRTYGGAVAGPRPIELRLGEKELAARTEKHSIAAAAASLVGSGDVLLLDAGTTTGQLALLLRDREGLTVITNGTNTLFTLAEADAVDVVVLGGHLRHTNQALIGPVAEEVLRHLYVDKAFLGADGVVAGRGICCASLEQATLKAVMASRARQVFVLADRTKLDRAPFAFWAPLSQPVTVITDAAASAAQVASVEQDPLITVVRTGQVTRGAGSHGATPATSPPAQVVAVGGEGHA